ncbi:uncharacterized protein RJT20DRAFT_79188, partial [Scheffersomyces xylosifermentans]|uniref:uncharacterized protein n=1 Tax=Scheffersomyces xylosifermentans TaxID=1304137 RepID=UPI00315CD963
MNVQFLYEDGESNLLDEQGRPVIDDMDVEGLIPLEILTNHQIYKLAEESLFNAEAMQVNRTKQKNDDNESVHRHVEVKSYGKSKRHFRMYTQQDREALFDLWTEKPGVPISKIAVKLLDSQRWIKEYVDTNLEDIPSPKPRGKPPFKMLNVEQKVHIPELVDDNASITLSEMMNSLTTSFEGLKVSYSSLQRFVKDECCLSFK